MMKSATRVRIDPALVKKYAFLHCSKFTSMYGLELNELRTSRVGGKGRC